ncbi:glycoside hydrolase family 3 protein [Kineococcus rhizosphaerae]|uniref:beta-glucosidase n=1 Tax=Kineococcus rhizosphaerae TaxID=559628 RepID=A0A2T0QZQ7_9ACTN|nr:glycoside hydrolase family 3 N-terminal domain-containing protein [Kineococcus rhizosphaerae]PRY12179.1 beta-glucosidase [Kineococcus rhizosphaerae]
MDAHPPVPRRLRRSRAAAVLAGLVAVTVGGTTAAGAAPATPAARTSAQPVLSTRGAPILDVGGLKFRDLDRDGRVTPYEDWRLTPEQRADDLLARLDLAQRAGLLVHGNLTSSGTTYDVAATVRDIADRHVTTMITRLSAEPAQIAEANNLVQLIAEQQPFGIPVLVSSDPRNGFSEVEGQTVAGKGTTSLPDPTGLAAAGDPDLTRRAGDVVRQEFRAMGIAQLLGPQADLATEPRWTRINGTFGSDAETARDEVRAYVDGVQGGTDGLTRDSVATVTKHWAGYGAQVNGYDSHYAYGRYAAFPGGNFEEHLVPYDGAFEAGTAGIMPTYSILENLVRDGHEVEQVGAGFNSYLLQDVLRGEKGFDGVVLSDWGITGDCPQECLDNRPPNSFIGSWGVGMPWGMENATRTERFAKALNAGVDQIGGDSDSTQVVAAVEQGLLSAERVAQAAHRVLVQKFQLGLFENPFVDPAAAGRLAGNARFQRIGDEAQERSLTLLQNTDDLLPVSRASVRTVYLAGIDPAVARARGLRVTEDPTKADLAVVRIADPRSGADLTGLEPTEEQADVRLLRAAAAAGTPTVAVPKLDRPLVLTGVASVADAVLANYGVSDEVLLDTVLGRRAPGGRLPFELPSSEAAVTAQLPDVADDSADPMFARGAGLSYDGR